MRFLSVSFVFAACVACLAEDEELGGKAGDPWIAFAPGTWAKFGRSTKTAGGTQVDSRKEILLRVEEKQLVFRFDETRGGKSETREEASPLTEPWTVHWTEIGKETLEVGGEKVECRILERDHRDGSGKTKSWRGIVDGKEIELKNEMAAETKAMKIRQTVATVKLSEEIVVGDARVSCRVEEFASETTQDGKTLKIFGRTWSSEKLPGGIGRSEVTEIKDGEETVTTTRLEAFGAPESD